MTKLTDTRQLKASNVNLVRTHLQEKIHVTKNDMAALTGLSIATCGTILREMVDFGEIKEVSLASSTGGRPAKTYSLNGDYHHIAAVYVRKYENSITIVSRITDLTGKVLKESQQSWKAIACDELYDFLDGLLEDDPLIHVIALGMPGVVRKGYMHTCDVSTFNDMDLGRQLKERYQIPVIIENDVNSTVLGFYQQCQNNKSESTVYIFYPHADVLGSGIIINGKILYGKSNFAGEAGALPLKDYSGSSTIAETDGEAFAEQAARMLMSYICIINPDNMVLSGNGINEKSMTAIQDQLNLLCHKTHQPELHWEMDIKDNYQWGLKSLALKTLNEAERIDQ